MPAGAGRTIRQDSGARRPAAAFAAVLFQQLHIGDDHAAVGGLAHVVDGEQSHLHGGQRFHLHAGLTDVFCGGGFESSNFSSTFLRLVGQNWDKNTYPATSVRDT